MNDQPLVTVNILSFNRKDELRNTLTKVFEQDYKNIEVIVVDNASSDGSAEMVKTEFTSVQLIQMKKNIGIAGWNEGFKVAKGEYVLVLDDDSYPETNSIEAALFALSENTDVGIIAFNIFNTKLNKSETTTLENNSPHYFVGCGAMIRKVYLDQVGYFDDLYFIYYNEVDLSIRMLKKGYKILYLKESFVIHNISNIRPLTLNKEFNVSEFRYMYFTIGYQIFLIKYFNLPSIFKYTIKWLINRIIIAIKYNYYVALFKTYKKIIFLLPDVLRKRDVVSDEVQRFFNYAKIPLIEREYFPGFIKPHLMKLKRNT